MPELGRIIVRNHLEFLHRVLRDLRGDAGTAGVLVKKLFGSIVAIDEELAIAARNLEPFRDLAPVALMLQLGSMLKAQVATLHTSPA